MPGGQNTGSQLGDREGRLVEAEVKLDETIGKEVAGN